MKGPSSSFHERIVSEERSGCFISLGLRKVLVVSGCKAGFLLIVSSLPAHDCFVYVIFYVCVSHFMILTLQCSFKCLNYDSDV